MKHKKSKFIFITGGVLSGLGKGVSAASIGNLIKSRGFSVFVQKFDPYYNSDPGTMNPFQHGEVFVTADGAETDLDLGHYERFINENFNSVSSITQGKILNEIFSLERNGFFHGETIQVVPHITNKIIEKLNQAATISKADFIITEIGGTVGDIESQPFIYAISQFNRLNTNNCFFIHVTFVPFLQSSQELKSKPTQQSISLLQSFGIFPNMILLRSNEIISDEFVKKISEKVMIDEKHCISIPNVDNIYKIPIFFENKNVAQIILEEFKIKNTYADLTFWKKFVDKIDQQTNKEINIAMVGKYIEYEDAYKSIIEAIKISSIWNGIKINFKWIQAEKIFCENDISKELINQNGVIILPGFGERGFNGKVLVAKFTREKLIPTLGICYGFQAMVVNQAIKNGIENATSSEVSKKGSFVIDIIKGKNTKNIGGTLRLGSSKTILLKNSLIENIYNTNVIYERHRHRYEVNHKFLNKIEDQEFTFSGFSEIGNFAEICELKNHPFYIGIQAHPEFNARPLREHPLFKNFLIKAFENKK